MANGSLGNFDVPIIAQFLRDAMGTKPEITGVENPLGIAADVGAKEPGQVPDLSVLLKPPEVPDEQADQTAQSTNGGGLNALFGNKNFLKLLAGIGTQLDPQGLGGMLGRPTTKTIEATAAQEAVAHREKQRNAQIKRVLDLLGGKFTPKDQPGPTSMTMNDTGFKLDVTSPSSEKLSMNPALEQSTIGAPPNRTRGFSLSPSDIFPFS